MFHVKTFRNDNYFLSSSILPLLFYYFVSFEKKKWVELRQSIRSLLAFQIITYFSTFLFTLSNLGVESWRLKCSKRKSTDSRTSQLFNIIRVWRVDEVEEKKINFQCRQTKDHHVLLIRRLILDKIQTLAGNFRASQKKLHFSLSSSCGIRIYHTAIWSERERTIERFETRRQMSVDIYYPITRKL